MQRQCFLGPAAWNTALIPEKHPDLALLQDQLKACQIHLWFLHSSFQEDVLMASLQPLAPWNCHLHVLFWGIGLLVLRGSAEMVKIVLPFAASRSLKGDIKSKGSECALEKGIWEIKVFLSPTRFSAFRHFDVLKTSPLPSCHGVYLCASAGRWKMWSVWGFPLEASPAFPECIVSQALWSNLPKLLHLATEHHGKEKEEEEN